MKGGCWWVLLFILLQLLKVPDLDNCCSSGTSKLRLNPNMQSCDASFSVDWSQELHPYPQRTFVNSPASLQRWNYLWEWRSDAMARFIRALYQAQTDVLQVRQQCLICVTNSSIWLRRWVRAHGLVLIIIHWAYGLGRRLTCGHFFIFASDAHPKQLSNA